MAWILLSNASVLSLEDGMLTLGFPRDGDLKGFTTSGCDADLKRVLSTGFGLNVTVKGVTGVDPGAGRSVARPGRVGRRVPARSRRAGRATPTRPPRPGPGRATMSRRPTTSRPTSSRRTIFPPTNPTATRRPL